MTTIPQNNRHSNTKYSQPNIPGLKELYPSSDTSFQGHYVVACGYDLPKQKIIYRNPSLCDRECMMSFQKFQEARESYGTDDDVIFVDIISSPQNSSSYKSDTKERSIKSRIKTHSQL